MANMATFCLNMFFPISHLENLSAYEILYGRKPPTISNLQLTGDDLIRPTFYRFTDYLDLLNELIHAIRDIVKENHNQTIVKRLQKHGSESPSLWSFNEGDIVYCHFPSKTIISHLKLSSKKLQMQFVGPLYIFSKHDIFMYLLSTSSQVSKVFLIYKRTINLIHVIRVTHTVSHVNQLQSLKPPPCLNKTIYCTATIHLTPWYHTPSHYTILFLHKWSNYRSHVTPSEYQSVDLSSVTYQYIAFIATPNNQLAFGKQSHIFLKKTSSQVY